jgi:hypothetical protein
VSWKKGNRLRVIPEDAADPPTRQIFADIRQALGLPMLRTFFPALAAYPQFLQLHWKMIKPVAQTREFFACADRLRADAYTRAHNYLRIPDLCACLKEARFSPCARRELTGTMELFHYGNPLLLLIFSAQMQALEGPVGEERPRTLLTAYPVFGYRPALVEEKNATPPVRHRYDEIRRVLELPYVNAEYEAMARFPDFLNLYWELIKSLLPSPLYQECQYGMRDTAWNLARELPGPLELPLEQFTDAGMRQGEIASLARILQLFLKNLGGLLIDVAIAKIALEGGNVAAPRKPAAKPESACVA